MFEVLNIPLELVSTGLLAMDTHSQKNMVFDPTKARNMTESELLDADRILSTLGLPFTTRTSVEDFLKITDCPE